MDSSSWACVTFIAAVIILITDVYYTYKSNKAPFMRGYKEGLDFSRQTIRWIWAGAEDDKHYLDLLEEINQEIKWVEVTCGRSRIGQ